MAKKDFKESVFIFYMVKKLGKILRWKSVSSRRRRRGIY